MNPQLLEPALRFAGLMLVGLAVANFVAARRWRYRENLAAADPIVRQVFHVHCAYIVVLIVALAVLCLGWPGLLLADGMGRVLSGFFAVFWGSRVVVQMLYYDRDLRREGRLWDLLFLGVFLSLGVIFALVAFLP